MAESLRAAAEAALSQLIEPPCYCYRVDGQPHDKMCPNNPDNNPVWLVKEQLRMALAEPDQFAEAREIIKGMLWESNDWYNDNACRARAWLERNPEQTNV